MGKKSDTIRYETVVQLLFLAVVILMPFLASSFMDYLELFSVSKTMIMSFWSSIKPWLSPSYVCLFINFIIFFIAASSSSSISSNPSSNTDSFFESSTLAHNLADGSLLPDDHDHDHDHDHSSFHTLEDTFMDRPQYGGDPRRLKEVVPESMVVDRGDLEEVSAESVVDMRELRKSKTFNGGELRSSCRKERYVRVLSQEELDRRVEAFIGTFKNKKRESNEGLKFGSIYEQEENSDLGTEIMSA